MKDFHLTKDRMRELMFGINTARLTEAEDSHIAGWRCQECANVMLEVVSEHLESPSAPTPE